MSTLGSIEALLALQGDQPVHIEELAELDSADLTNLIQSITRRRAKLREVAERRRPITVFTSDQFPSAATHCPQEECGFSLYRGVLVQWDEDRDDRVLGVLDRMPSKIIDRLLVVQEHEGSISFLWDGPVPKGYESDSMDGVETPGDWWNIYSSVGIE